MRSQALAVLFCVARAVGGAFDTGHAEAWKQWAACKADCGAPPPGQPPTAEPRTSLPPTPTAAAAVGAMYAMLTDAPTPAPPTPPTPVPPTPVPTPSPTPVPRPRIVLRGDNPMYVLASGEPFRDPGAECSLARRGDLNAALTTAGDVVGSSLGRSADGGEQRRRSFRVQYLCRAPNGEEAPPTFRTVVLATTLTPGCDVVRVVGLPARLLTYAAHREREGDYQNTGQHHDGRPVYRQVARAGSSHHGGAATDHPDSLHFKPNYLYYERRGAGMGAWVLDHTAQGGSRHQGLLAYDAAMHPEQITAAWRGWDELSEKWVAAPAFQARCASLHCHMHPWGTWTPCTLKCDGGHRIRTRDIGAARDGGGHTCSMQVQESACNTAPCPSKYRNMLLAKMRARREGGARSWLRGATACRVLNEIGQWSACSARCGPHGVRFRLRERYTCDPPARHVVRQAKPCHRQPCSSVPVPAEERAEEFAATTRVRAPALTPVEDERAAFHSAFWPQELPPRVLGLDEDWGQEAGTARVSADVV